MSDYGPKGFEKEFKKRIKDFNETKIFFNHHKNFGGEVYVQYIDGDKLLSINMYRSDFELDRWLNHFQSYLDTGVFDTNAYWEEYQGRHIETNKNKVVSDVIPMPMELKKQVWDVHTKQFHDFMTSERKAKGDMGFKLVAKPLEV